MIDFVPFTTTIETEENEIRTEARWIAEYLSDIEAVLTSPEPEVTANDFEGYDATDTDLAETIAVVSAWEKYYHETADGIERQAQKIFCIQRNNRGRLIDGGVPLKFMNLFETRATNIIENLRNDARRLGRIKAQLMGLFVLDTAEALYSTLLPAEFEELLTNQF